MSASRTAVTERFWSKVDTSSGPEGCWPWTAGCNPRGYGRINVDGSAVLAHRLSYELAKGPIPDGLLVCHRCDNPPCCNPVHLYAGTHADNTADMVRRGRSPDTRGERSGKAKVTAASVDAARRRHSEGASVQDVAAELGVDTGHASRILSGERWGPNPYPPPIRPSAAASERRVRRLAAPSRHQVEKEARRSEMVRLYGDGLSTPEIARRLGTHAGNVSRHLRAAGVTMRGKKDYAPQVSRDELVGLLESGLRGLRLARHLHISEKRLGDLLDEYGIPRARPGRPPRSAA